MRADAGAERFGNRLLRREARRQKRRGRFVRQAIGDFVGMQDAFEKPFAEPLVRGLDAGHFDDVYAEAENHV